LVTSQTQLNLPTAIAAAADLQPVPAPADVQEQVRMSADHLLTTGFPVVEGAARTGIG
jgi:hypothetical protein